MRRFTISFSTDLKKKNVCITWSIWTYRNNVVFRMLKAKPGHIINLAVNLFDDMRYYNLVSSFFGIYGSACTYSKAKTNS